LGPGVEGLKAGDPVVLSWNPHCGHCFYCEQDQPILCESYLRLGPRAVQFDGTARLVNDASESELSSAVRALSDAKYGWSDGLIVEITPQT